MANALVYIELEENQSVGRPSLLALNKARLIASRLGATLYAIVPCAAPPSYGEDDIVAVLSRHGADKVVLVTNPQLAPPALFDAHGNAFLHACEQFPPLLVLVPGSEGGEELACRVALRLGGYFVADVEIDDNGDPSYSRTAFRRRFSCRERLIDAERPLVLYLAPSDEDAAPMGAEEAEVLALQAPTRETSSRLALDGQGAPPAGDGPLVALGGGAGLTTSEGFALLRDLADALGASVAATESACESGIAERALYAGVGGRSIDADVYLAFGISGSEGHLAALAPHTRVVAINSDPEAEIFKVASCGIVGDATAILRELLAEVRGEGIEDASPEEQS